MQPTVKPITIWILLAAALAGIGFWYLTYVETQRAAHRVVRHVERMPHGPRPADAVRVAPPRA